MNERVSTQGGNRPLAAQPSEETRGGRDADAARETVERRARAAEGVERDGDGKETGEISFPRMSWTTSIEEVFEARRA